MSLQSKEELSQNKKILSQKANNKFRNLFQNQINSQRKEQISDHDKSSNYHSKSYRSNQSKNLDQNVKSFREIPFKNYFKKKIKIT